MYEKKAQTVYNSIKSEISKKAKNRIQTEQTVLQRNTTIDPLEQ